MNTKIFYGFISAFFILLPIIVGAEESSSTRANNHSQETIYGKLRKSSKPQACTQITDSLNESYLVFRTQKASKSCKPFLNKSVELVGEVEEDPDTGQYYIRLKEVRLAKTVELKKKKEERKKEEIDISKNTSDSKKKDKAPKQTKANSKNSPKQRKKPRKAPSGNTEKINSNSGQN